MGGGGGPLIDVERGLRDVQRGAQRGFEDLFGITQQRRLQERFQRQLRRGQQAAQAQASDEGVSAGERARIARRRRALGMRGGGRGGTILTGPSGTTLLGVTGSQKTLLGM